MFWKNKWLGDHKLEDGFPLVYEAAVLKIGMV